jgi:hypothetical protein
VKVKVKAPLTMHRKQHRKEKLKLNVKVKVKAPLTMNRKQHRKEKLKLNVNVKVSCIDQTISKLFGSHDITYYF